MRVVNLESSQRALLRSFWWWSFTIIVASIYFVQRAAVFLAKLIFDKSVASFDRRLLHLVISISIGLQISHYYFKSSTIKRTGTIGQFILYWLILLTPRRTLSTLMGKLCRTHIQSPYIRSVLYSWWCRHYRVITSEILKPLDSYPSLDAFFTRKINLSTRKNFKSKDTGHLKDKEEYSFFFNRELLVGTTTPHNGILCEATVRSSTFLFSPADSVLTSYGIFSSPYMQTLTCKGLVYSATDLLAPDVPDGNICLCKNTILHWAVFYLSPGDYHRFHAPCDMLITEHRYAHGDLLPVNSLFLSRVKGLLASNERVILSGSYKLDGHTDPLYLGYVAVGALNVGSIEISVEGRQHNHNAPKTRKELTKIDPREYKTGEEVGQFHFGSTIVLVYEVPITYKVIHLAEEQKPIRVGDELLLITKQH